MRAIGQAPLLLCLLLASVPGTARAEEPVDDSLMAALLAVGAAAAAAVERGAERLEPRADGLTADWLARWIRATRDGAEARGVDALPPALRTLFAGRVPEAALARVRWRIDDTGFSVQQALFRSGYTQALTVDDVILFADADAAASAVLWAHELAHVLQYADWGVDGFVARYVDDHDAIEHAANELSWQWLRAASNDPSATD